MKPHVILIALLGGCTHAAVPLEDGQVPDRNGIVLAGFVARGDGLELTAATGRVYAVRTPGGRFSVTVPAGVYEVTSIGGVRPGVPLGFDGIPGDRLDLGSLDVSSTAVGVTSRVGSLGGSQPETPLRYYARTGQPVRPLPVPQGWGGGSRVGMGLRLRSR